MRLAIITPRYGAEIGGGAETLARGLAQHAAAQGWEVHVWTSRARDYHTWQPVYPPGSTQEAGVTVHRFETAVVDLPLHQQLSQKLAREQTLSPAGQMRWLRSGAHSPALYAHVRAHLRDQAPSFDAVLALPYLSTLTLTAAWAAPPQIIFLPCLHDEPPAYLLPVRGLLQNVRGLLFLTPEEQALALDKLRLSPRRQDVLGVGVDAPAAVETASVPGAPYLLAVGRLEQGKNLRLLYDAGRRLYDDTGGAVRVVLAGRGDFQPPDHPAFEARGFVPEEEKFGLMANALALCHPSRNESFSIVLMEAWLMGTPALVHAGCAVTAGHVARSGGGLTFATYADFAAAVARLRRDAALRRTLGENGRDYVQHHYTWPRVLRKLGTVLQAWPADA